MSKVVVSYGELMRTAKKFHEAATDSERLRRDLEKQVEILTRAWQDSASQPFHEAYMELNAKYSVIVTLMDMIGKEIEAIAKRYEEINL